MAGPADPVYPVVFFEVNPRRWPSQEQAAYVALALNPNGEKDVLGLWIEPQSSCRSLRAARAGGGRRP